MLPFAVPAIDPQFVGVSYIATKRANFDEAFNTGPLADIGVQVGDLMVAIWNTHNSLPGTGWTLVSTGSFGRVYYKPVVTADMGGVASGGWGIAFYRGASSLSVRTNATTPGNNTGVHTFPGGGFAKSLNHAGLIGFTRATGATFQVDIAPIDGLGTWQRRNMASAFYPGSADPTTWTEIQMVDYLYPPNPLYTDNKPFSFNFSGGDTRTCRFDGYILELLS